jgi:hypothetical protein
VPVPFGPGPLPLTADERAGLADLIGDVKAANAKLLNAFGESVRDCREHEHPKSEDFHCLNLTAWMGERAGLVLRRLLDVEAENARLRARASELEGIARDAWSYAAQLEGRLREIEQTPFNLDAEVSADKLTRLLAPTQALREDPHDSPLHRDWRLGRDLPEMGGSPC